MSGICESLCVQMLCENDEFVKELDRKINEHYESLKKDMCKYRQFQGLVRDFSKSNADTSFSTLFTNAFGCAKSNSEMYGVIREIFFKIMLTCQQVVIHLNRTVGSTETMAITLVSFYKYLLRSSKQKKAANAIFEHIKEFQAQTIMTLMQDAVKETQSLKCFITEVNLQYLEYEIYDRMYKLLQPVNIMHFCLDELSKINYYMDLYYNILQNVWYRDSCVDMDADMGWKCSTTKSLFMNYFSSLLATRLLYKDFIQQMEKLRDNFRCMMHHLPELK